MEHAISNLPKSVVVPIYCEALRCHLTFSGSPFRVQDQVQFCRFFSYSSFLDSVCVCDKGIEGGGEELFCAQHCSGKEESNKILLEYSALLS